MPTELVLGFDFGMNRIGIAVGQKVTGTATPLTVLKARDGMPDWTEIQRLIDEWQPAALVVGLPLNMDGTDSDMSERAERFGRRLEGRFGLPVAMVDERLSTREAQTHVEPGQPLDAVAAKLILETWLAD